MSTRTLKFVFWLAIIALVMACVPSLAAPLPTANPNEVSTFIAQTANAAASRTAAVLPSSTPTATTTPTPRNTDTATPTITPTVIFILASPTRVTPTTLVIIGGGGGGGGGGGSSGGGTSSADYACQIVNTTPSNGTTFNGRDKFDGKWRVKNIGQENWGHNNVDFVYLSGAKIHDRAGFDLPQDINSGTTADLIVDMTAPNDPGTYTTTWTLQVGDRTFCNMTLTIRVR